MIPERYREVLPPYWYENEMAEHHFHLMEDVMDDHEQKIYMLRDQFILSRATFAMDIWDWIFFRKTKVGSLEERKEAIRKRMWAKLPFRIPVLRIMGELSGNLITVTEDFLAKEILFEYDSGSFVDVPRLYRDFEYKRPVHINRAMAVVKSPDNPIIVKNTVRNFDVKYKRCGTFVATNHEYGSVSGEGISLGGSGHTFMVRHRRCGTFRAGQEVVRREST